MNGITAEHPEYSARTHLFQTYGDLYAGGDRIQSNVQKYLLPRQKEPFPTWMDRCSRAYYDNYIGSIIDWYAATLFRREPMIALDGDDPNGRSYYNQLNDNCDRQGTALTDFLRQRFIEAAVYGSSHIVVDFPRVSQAPRHRGEELELGAGSAYLAGYGPQALVNWSKDDDGQYEWAVIRTSQRRKASPEQKEWELETRWFYFDREKFKVFRNRKKGMESADGAVEVEQVDEGYHGLAKIKRVPVFDLRFSDGLWLMNKSASLQLEHFNKANALSYAIHIGLFAMPVVYTDKEFNQPIGESYYVMLGQNDRFGWTEPQGHVYNIAANNLETLQREIYRVSYLLSQAGGGGAVPQSGLSKLRDYSITIEVLRAYGDGIKDLVRKVLGAIHAVRVDGVSVDVLGLDDFDIGEFGEELSNAERLLQLGIDSPTLMKQVKKKVALKYLSDSKQEIKDQIAVEIESGVTEAARDQGE